MLTIVLVTVAVCLGTALLGAPTMLDVSNALIAASTEVLTPPAAPALPPAPPAKVAPVQAAPSGFSCDETE